MRKLFILSLIAIFSVGEVFAQVFPDTLLNIGNTSSNLNVSPPVSNKFTFKESFNRNATYAGLIFIADGLLIKSQKKDFRSIKTFFQPHFEKTYDNYTQYAPLAATFALKALGVKSVSSWKRMTLNSVTSFAFMNVFVNSIKYTTKEMRPDNTSANSFPSGHTATAFMAATIFHKEYGYLSPWYSIGGYGLATLTGVTRIMNNRHWISDVLVGAGLGIVSVDLGYMLGDLILGGKGVEHISKNMRPDISESASFFSLTVGAGQGPNHLNTPEIYDDYDADMKPTGNPLNLRIKTGLSSSVNVEGAYFFNKYFGVGGRLKASSLPLAVESFNGYENNKTNPFKYSVGTGDAAFDKSDIYKLVGLESSNLGMIDLAVGTYFSLPIGTRIRVGTKFLVGNRLTTDYSVDAIFGINENNSYVKEIGVQTLEDLLNSIISDYSSDGAEFTRDAVNPHLYHDSDFMSIEANNSLTVGTGLSFTYAIKNNVAFKFNLDYDFANPKYTFKLHNRYDSNGTTIEDSFQKRTSMNSINLNMGMCICL